MQKSNSFPRVILFLALLTSLLAGVSAPALVDESVSAAPKAVVSAGDVVISEFRFLGPAGGNDEFIELYNPKNIPVDITGLKIMGSNNAGGGTSTPRATLGSVTLQVGQHYLLVNDSASAGLLALEDATYSTGITEDGGIALTLADGTTIIDAVGLSPGSAYKEGTTLPPLNGTTDQSYERIADILSGTCNDTGNNLSDFFVRSPSDPQNLASPITTCGNPTPVPLPPAAPLSLVINEVGWSGTISSPNDEWIELYNPGSSDINLNGWSLVADDGTPDISFTLTDSIPAEGFFVLGRFDNIFSDAFFTVHPFTGAIENSDEVLRLVDPGGTPVDSANSQNVSGGAWPAGTSSPNYASMERISPISPDSSVQWATFADTTFVVHDRTGQNVKGTPGYANWTFLVTITPSPTLTPTLTITSTPTPTSTGTPTGTSTPTRTLTPTGTLPTPTQTPLLTATTLPTLNLLINEVAWAGTAASSEDEWIELYNPGTTTISLIGWTLKTDSQSVTITWNASDMDTDFDIEAGTYYLIERGSDNFAVSDITYDKSFTGALSNSGEVLRLLSPANQLVDIANADGGAWPAGIASPYYSSMERYGNRQDGPASWVTNTGVVKNGLDAGIPNGCTLTSTTCTTAPKAINGTPRQANWASTVTVTPSAISTSTRTPTRVPPKTAIPPVGRPIINEFLPRPGFDWNQDGKVDVYDEFIEIKNIGNADINLSGWKLDDEANLGSNPFTLPSITLKVGERMVFYGLQTNILLSDGGDTVRLMNPGGKIYDAYTYSIAKFEDESVCRLPDGHGDWYEDCVPTPNLTNTREGIAPSMPGGVFESPVCELPDTLPADFLFAECRGFGANIWDSYYWDKFGWQGVQYIPENTSRWESFVE